MNRRLTILVIPLAIALVAPVVAHASILGDMLHFDGSENLIEDNSVGVLVDTTSDGTPDLLQGIVYIDSINGVATPSVVSARTLFAVYSFAITETSAGSGVFTSTAATGGNSVESLLSPGGADFSALALRSGSTVVDEGFAFIEIDGSFTAANWKNVAGSSSPLSLEFDSGSGFSADLSDFTVVMTLGFDGVDDYHVVDFDDDIAIPRGFFDGVYSVKRDIFDPAVVYLPTELGVDIGPGGFGDLVIGGGTIGRVSSGDGGRGFGLSDQGEYMLAAVPEPSSMLVFALLIGVGMIVGLFRSCQGK